MNLRLTLLSSAVVLFAAVACEKAGHLVEKVKAVAGAAGLQKPGTEVDPALRALVNENAEGTIFRKDVPFPGRLNVRVTRTSHSEGSKVLVRSELGPQSSVRSGTETVTSLFRVAGNYVRLSLEMAQFESPVDPGEKGTVAKITPYPLAGRSVDFRLEGGRWLVEGAKGMQAKTWAEGLAPGMRALLVDNGVRPRSYWFGERRFKVGEVVPLSGESLAILFGEKCSGSVTLTLEAFESFDGHPCGVFGVKGGYKRRDHLRPDGELIDEEEVTIESGKVWLSVIYPLVLREEMRTIETRVSGRRGGVSTRSQGAFHTTVIRQWMKEES